MPNGVIYWLSGRKLCVRLLVSLRSLRNHYDGPITVITAHAPDEFLDILATHGIEIKQIEWPRGGKEALLGKCAMNRFTPYGCTVFIDCDTLVVGAIDDLFYYARDGMAFVQFADWKSWGAVGKRIKNMHRMDYISEEDRDAAIKYGPAINIGVFSFMADHPMWPEWYELAKKATRAPDKMFIADECAAQCLIHKYKPHIMENKFNVSMNRPGYLDKSPELREDWRILHYAGRAHLSRKSGEWKNIWFRYAHEIWKRDDWNIRSVMENWRYKEAENEGIRKGHY